MNIVIIPLPALKDNYIWLGINKSLNQAFVVDPGDATPVLNYLTQHNLKLIAIFATHKHADHVGGISALLNHFPNIPVYAHPTENIPQTTHFVTDGEKISIPSWEINFEVIHIPGHTLGHVAYYSKPILFCGDTLFAAGCGRVFEGTPEQMLNSLNKLVALGDDTLIYCGHEYTVANLKFALQVEPNNHHIKTHLQSIEQIRSKNEPSLPSPLSVEKMTNPFLRCTEPSIIQSVEHHYGENLSNTAMVFHHLREWKNKI